MGKNNIIELKNVIKRCNHGKMSNNLEQLFSAMASCGAEISTVEELVEAMEEELFCWGNP